MSVTLLRDSGGTGPVHSACGISKEIVAIFKYAAVYATGGETIDLSSHLLDVPDIVLFEPAGGYIFAYNHSTGKVMAYTQDGSGPLVEVAPSADLTSLEIRFLAKRYM